MACAEKVQSYGPGSRQGGKGGSRKGTRTSPEAAVHSTVTESAPNGSRGHGAARRGRGGGRPEAAVHSTVSEFQLGDVFLSAAN